MTITAEGPVKLYLEHPDGTVHELTGSLTEFEIDHHVNIVPLDRRDAAQSSVMGGVPVITANFTIVGDLYKLFKPNEFEVEVYNRSLDREWMCDWCGSPNVWLDRHCDRCGGVRSFIYE